MRKEIVVRTPEALDLYRHDGAWYRKVARRAEYLDLVYVADPSAPEFDGVYQAVVLKNEGQVLVVRDGERDSALEVDLAGYSVLEPLDTSATGDYHAHDGGPDGSTTLYRKERRKAQVGELVLMMTRDGFEDWAIGDVLTVESATNRLAYFTMKNYGAWPHEYVVLVPVAHVEPVVPEPPTITYSDEFATATRESVYEVWARGKAAMARKEIEDLEARIEAVHEKASEQDDVTAEDADLVADYCEQAASLHRQVAHWRRKVTEYTALADATAAKIKERKVA